MNFGLRCHVATRAALVLAVSFITVNRPSYAGEASLEKPLAQIETAFRTQKPEALTTLLPGEGKIYLSLDSLGGGIGYFSRDQVYYLLGGMLTRHQTISFTIKPQKAASITAEKPRPDSRLSYCIGLWTFHRRDGAQSESQIFFVLSMRKGVWSLVEIREAQ